MDASLKDRAFALLQWLLPTRPLSLGMYALTRVRWAPFKTAFIRLFMRGFRISLDEAEIQDPAQFADFNAFFTRALKADARPLQGGGLVSPVDGTLSQCGPLTDDRLIQAKGHDYRCEALLSDAAWAAEMRGGEFATIYLAPYNYHRIHMPLTGQLRAWRYLPGRLFSVNAATARAMPGLFARNERLVAMFDSERGPFAMVLVGALFVGGLETVWTGAVTPPHRRGAPGPIIPASHPLSLARGQEMGRFNMGSTVILVGAPGALQLDPALALGQLVKVGQAIGR
jgi:phosphatidylserine decarboxylase